MDNIVFAGIAPHGFSMIAEISGDELELFKPTRDAMEKFGERLMKEKPDSIIIFTPHGLKLKDNNAIYVSEFCRGTIEKNNAKVSLEYKCDRKLANMIAEEAEKRNIPIIPCNFGSMEGEVSNIEMDWGTFIPLWFCQDEKYKPEIVVISPSREIPLEELVSLGESISDVSKESGKKIAIIASADQAHCHTLEGPYGIHEDAERFDKEIVDIISENRLGDLLDIDMEYVNNAKPDSIWQLLILHGILKSRDLKSEVLSYQMPTYFGMVVATFQ